MSITNAMLNGEDAVRVQDKGWHLVTSTSRYKTLRKRGEDIKWSVLYNCWIWDFKNRKVQNDNR